MLFAFTPLVDKNHDKKRGHSKIDALGVKREQGARQAAERGTGDPVDLVQQGNEEVKEPAVDPLRRLRRAQQRKGFVRQ